MSNPIDGFNWSDIVSRISDDQVPSRRLTDSEEANLRSLLKPKFDIPSMRSVSGVSSQEAEEDVVQLLDLVLTMVRGRRSVGYIATELKNNDWMCDAQSAQMVCECLANASSEMTLVAAPSIANVAVTSSGGGESFLTNGHTNQQAANASLSKTGSCPSHQDNPSHKIQDAGIHSAAKGPPPRQQCRSSNASSPDPLVLVSLPAAVNSPNRMLKIQSKIATSNAGGLTKMAVLDGGSRRKFGGNSRKNENEKHDWHPEEEELKCIVGPGWKWQYISGRGTKQYFDPCGKRCRSIPEVKKRCGELAYKPKTSTRRKKECNGKISIPSTHPMKHPRDETAYIEEPLSISTKRKVDEEVGKERFHIDQGHSFDPHKYWRCGCCSYGNDV